MVDRFINADGFVSTGQGITSYNIFAYCGNNPVINSDSTGNMYVREAGGGFVPGFSGGGAGGGSATRGRTSFWYWLKQLISGTTIGGVIGGGSATLGIDALRQEKTDIKSKEREKTKDITLTKEEPDEQAVYYGADTYGGVWKTVTGPLTYGDAIDWVNNTAESGIYGRGASWGVYTEKESDAIAIAVALGPINTIPDKVTGCYPHYHFAGHTFGKYKHFHIWYGGIVP